MIVSAGHSMSSSRHSLSSSGHPDVASPKHDVMSASDHSVHSVPQSPGIINTSSNTPFWGTQVHFPVKIRSTVLSRQKASDFPCQNCSHFWSAERTGYPQESFFACIIKNVLLPRRVFYVVARVPLLTVHLGTI